jgi:hypothetical protein
LLLAGARERGLVAAKATLDRPRARKAVPLHVDLDPHGQRLRDGIRRDRSEMHSRVGEHRVEDHRGRL